MTSCVEASADFDVNKVACASQFASLPMSRLKKAVYPKIGSRGFREWLSAVEDQ